MIYKDFEIYENVKSYSVMSLDDNGERTNVDYNFEGYDFISYSFVPCDGEYGYGEEPDCKTIEECKQLIDNKVTEKEN